MNNEVSRNAMNTRRVSLGFWIYLMTDCMLFASLFAVFAVLRTSTAGSPGGAQLFEMPLVLVETIVLLVSSFSAGFVLIGLKLRSKKVIIGALISTYVLGLIFLSIELGEFNKLIGEGFGWDKSAFLSAFFVLVGTHGFHILIGLLWLMVMVVTLVSKGLKTKSERQLKLFVLYWHFLDLVWIFVFSVVYLMGVVI